MTVTLSAETVATCVNNEAASDDFNAAGQLTVDDIDCSSLWQASSLTDDERLGKCMKHAQCLVKVLCKMQL
jgi:hypothetical protein